MDTGNQFGYVDTYLPQHIILIRLAIAAVLGGLIGFERERVRGSAGLRTHILIGMGAALFTILAFEIFHTIGTDSQADPIRAVEAVTAGIAFLGAGAIFQARGAVHGITTGAGMWLAGAVGVTIALGHYTIGAAVAIFAVVVLAALRAFAHHVVRADPENRDKVPTDI